MLCACIRRTNAALPSADWAVMSVCRSLDAAVTFGC